MTRSARKPGLCRRLGKVPVLATALALSLTLAACTSQDAPPPPATPSSARPVELTVGIYGSKPEIDAFAQIVESFNAQAVSSRARLVSWPDRAAMMADVEAGKPLPDLYMVSRGDLAEIRERQLNQPVFELLDDRDIRYGDEYVDSAIAAFSADNNLQCMPYSASPMVMYYNTDLIDFDKMARRGLPVPTDPERLGWSFGQFSAAASFASRPQRGTKGVSVDPTLRSLAPFVYSGDGDVFNDDDTPTSLDLSSENSRSALTTALQVLRDPTVTLSAKQLSRATPTQWFKRGKLGMIEGFRGLTPELRDVDGLDFDVISMPRLDQFATVGDMEGLCLSPGGFINKKADFLVHAISDASFASVAETGYVVPVKTSIARSSAFLQPGLQPEHAAVFNASVDTIQLAPLSDRYDELTAAVSPLLRTLLTTPVLTDVTALTEQIDEASRSVLDPDYVATPSPGVPSTGTPSSGASSPGGSSSGAASPTAAEPVSR